METIEMGDKVKHRSLNNYNSILMTVTEIEENKVVCDYLDNGTKEIKSATFNLNDLELVRKVEGGFIP